MMLRITLQHKRESKNLTPAWREEYFNISNKFCLTYPWINSNENTEQEPIKIYIMDGTSSMLPFNVLVMLIYLDFGIRTAK